MSDTDAPDTHEAVVNGREAVITLAKRHGLTINYWDGDILNGSVYADGPMEALRAFDVELKALRKEIVSKSMNKLFGKMPSSEQTFERAGFAGGTVELFRREDGEIEVFTSRPAVEYVSSYPQSMLDDAKRAEDEADRNFGASRGMPLDDLSDEEVAELEETDKPDAARRAEAKLCAKCGWSEVDHKPDDTNREVVCDGFVARGEGIYAAGEDRVARIGTKLIGDDAMKEVNPTAKFLNTSLSNGKTIGEMLVETLAQRAESVEPPRRLVWIDLETTGLDPRRDCILEIACIITDADLMEIAVYHDTENANILPDALRKMDEKVLKMHTDSGLLEAIKNKPLPTYSSDYRSRLPEEDGDLQYSRSEGMRLFLAFIKQHVSEQGRGLLAGSSVGFDKGFLRENMPELLDHLHYRILDVSVIKEACRLWAPELMEPKATNIAHRALADLRASVAEARRYRDTVFSPAREVFFCGSDVEPAEGSLSPGRRVMPTRGERLAEAIENYVTHAIRERTTLASGLTHQSKTHEKLAAKYNAEIAAIFDEADRSDGFVLTDDDDTTRNHDMRRPVSSDEACATCNGKGTVDAPLMGSPMMVHATCFSCLGTGRRQCFKPSTTLFVGGTNDAVPLVCILRAGHLGECSFP